MVKPNITPGPWVFSSSAIKANWPGPDTVTICEANLIRVCDGKLAPREEQIANLQLISAAPELMEALAFCRSVMLSNGIFELSEKIAVEKAEAALRKSGMI